MFSCPHCLIRAKLSFFGSLLRHRTVNMAFRISEHLHWLFRNQQCHVPNQQFVCGLPLFVVVFLPFSSHSSFASRFRLIGGCQEQTFRLVWILLGWHFEISLGLLASTRNSVSSGILHGIPCETRCNACFLATDYGAHGLAEFGRLQEQQLREMEILQCLWLAKVGEHSRVVLAASAGYTRKWGDCQCSCD